MNVLSLAPESYSWVRHARDVHGRLCCQHIRKPNAAEGALSAMRWLRKVMKMRKRFCSPAATAVVNCNPKSILKQISRVQLCIWLGSANLSGS